MVVWSLSIEMYQTNYDYWYCSQRLDVSTLVSLWRNLFSCIETVVALWSRDSRVRIKNRLRQWCGGDVEVVLNVCNGQAWIDVRFGEREYLSMASKQGLFHTTDTKISDIPFRDTLFFMLSEE